MVLAFNKLYNYAVTRLEGKRGAQKTSSASNHDTRCAICLSNIQPSDPNRLSFPCGHLYHLKCAADSLTKDMRCALCRENIDLKNELSTYKQQLKREPDDPYAHHNYALALKDSILNETPNASTSDTSTVFEHLVTAIELDFELESTTPSTLWLDLANNWPENKDTAELTLHDITYRFNRADCYQKVLELEPDNAEAKAWIQALQNRPTGTSKDNGNQSDKLDTQ